MQDCQGVSTWKAKWLENHPAPCFEIHSVLTCLQKVGMQLAPLRWKVVCQRHCLHKKVSKPYSLPTKIFTHIGSIWMRVVVPWVLRAINHIQGKQMASSYPCTIYVVTLLFTQTVSSQLANGPTRRCIKSSRNVGELVLNPIQLIRS